MSWTPPTACQFKQFFNRDFWYAKGEDCDNLDLVNDNDINNAIAEAQINFNTALYGSDSNITTVFLYLAAFMLVRKIQVSEKGLASQSRFPISSNSVGGVSINFSFPEQYAKDPWLSSLTVNGYGMRFLEFTLPYLVGNVLVVGGNRGGGMGR
jgi:Protein of unknown function (DUF4054)